MLDKLILFLLALGVLIHAEYLEDDSELLRTSKRPTKVPTAFPTTRRPKTLPPTTKPTPTPSPSDTDAETWIKTYVASHPCVEFGTKTCESCAKAKKFFASIGATFNVVEFETLTSPSGPEVQSAMTLMTSSKFTPYIWISSKYAGSWEDIEALDHDGKLRPMLVSAGCLSASTISPQPSSSTPKPSTAAPSTAPTTIAPGKCPSTCKTCYWPQGNECLGTRITKNDCQVFTTSHSTLWCGN